MLILFQPILWMLGFSSWFAWNICEGNILLSLLSNFLSENRAPLVTQELLVLLEWKENRYVSTADKLVCLLRTNNVRNFKHYYILFQGRTGEPGHQGEEGPEGPKVSRASYLIFVLRQIAVVNALPYLVGRSWTDRIYRSTWSCWPTGKRNFFVPVLVSWQWATNNASERQHRYFLCDFLR